LIVVQGLYHIIEDVVATASKTEKTRWQQENKRHHEAIEKDM